MSGAASLGLLFLVAQLFVLGPLDIWTRNADFMAFGVANHLIVLLSLSAILFALGRVLLRLVPSRHEPLCASILVALGVTFWLYASFLFRDSLLLNGREAEFDLSAGHEIIEFVGFVVVVAGIALLTRRFPDIIKAWLLLLLAGQTVVTAYGAAVRIDRGMSIATPAASPLWRLSAKSNVVVLVLDTLQSDVAHEILDRDPILARSFAGFVNFRDVAGIAPTTYPSIPTIHSGIGWNPDESLTSQYDRGVHQRSFMAQLARGGFETVQINPMIQVCHSGATLCTDSASILDSRLRRLAIESAKLIDFSLVRALPYFAKDWVFNSQALWLSRWLGDWGGRNSFMVSSILGDFRFLDTFAANVTAQGDRPSAKFIHLMATHPPFVLGPECKPAPAMLVGSAGALNAAHCTFIRLAAVLDRFRALGVYDDATIVIAADHGGMRPLVPPEEFSKATDLAFRLMAGAASPALLVKRPKANGPLRQSYNPVSVADIAATICSQAAECVPEGGRSVFAEPEADPAKSKRTFRSYVWKNAYWSLGRVPNTRAYDISARIWDPAAWTAAAAEYKLGTFLRFQSGGSASEYLGAGWASSEAWGTWTTSRNAYLRLGLTNPVAKDLVVTFTASAFLAGEHNKLDLVVRANGFHVASWTIETPNPQERRIVIPSAHVKKGGGLTIAFEVGNPRSPQELGIAQDPRTLGLGLIALTIDAVAPPSSP